MKQIPWDQWIASQGPQDWWHAVLSVKNQRGRVDLVNTLISSTLKVALRSVDQSVYGNAHRRYGKQVLRLPVFGGDRELGVLAHEHMLIAKPAFTGTPEFVLTLSRAWNFSITNWLQRRLPRRYLRSGEEACPYGEVWVEQRYGDVSNIVNYAMRYEGPTFGAGQSKVDFENYYLKPMDS